ncbi:flagellar assembly peptidoglycan hydrolase FlgJ [Undibacterium seohonense]|jgi:flagellar protein FlgJ|uniref:Peptidoglycan hydrolase FlgJ n=1 Tax=Undibacterium seohonense TaxID=1344950 RepID=A0ABR6X8K9_9BURK|nr:flagellar assembly peptidoglycan hydrolase FlgJ [Undibacterium seohonense]MBC3808664.1 flagellar assembly peptidoglycan hydrolase FlgJ [Undibacterium seohonense]
MIGRTDMSEQLAFDSKSLNALRHSSKDNSAESIKAAATQFEALFVNMMLKSMRQAGGGEGGMFDNEQSRMYTSMMDQQISQKMASRGIGLADAMVRQLTNNAMSQVLQTEEAPTVPLGGMGAINQYVQQQKNSLQADQILASTGSIESNSSSRHVQEFTQKLGVHAELASQSTGIPAKFMLGQAALESGWGKKEIKALDGSTSHNVFGIKANANWKGRTVDALTTEYINGVAYQKVEKFRAYGNYSEAFRDYAKLISDNPRYQNVMQNTGDASQFAHALQKAGYATDPQYAQKLSKVIRQSFSG